MFSFHKPKIYRSLLGCCICRAKSSSSRFTDSKKYESEFEKCFRINEKRSGEICNACVLLVKRWKKLPTGTNKDWHHVVDARAGPGTKSFKTSSTNGSHKSSKNQNNSDEQTSKQRQIQQQQQKSSSNSSIANNSNGTTNRNNGKISMKSSSSSSSQRHSSPTTDDSGSSGAESDPSSDVDDMPYMDMVVDDDDVIDGLELDLVSRYHYHRFGSEQNQMNKRKSSSTLRRSTRLAANGGKTREFDENELHAQTYRHSAKTGHGNSKMLKKHRSKLYRDQFVSFLDSNFWKREKICCGIIFKGPNNEVLIYPELFQPCCNSSGLQTTNGRTTTIAKNTTATNPSINKTDSKNEQQKIIPTLIKQKPMAPDDDEDDDVVDDDESSNQSINDSKPMASTNKTINSRVKSTTVDDDNTQPPELIKPPSFQNTNSNSSNNSINQNHHNKSEHEMMIMDDQSSGVLSMIQCDENSMQDSICSDRLSTVSSSLCLDNDDGNMSESTTSDVFDEERDDDGIVVEQHCVVATGKSVRTGNATTAKQSSNARTANNPPSLAVV